MPKPGSLLISEPFLQDENFVRSVILMCENNENGSFGLVLNKLSILKLNDLIEDLSFLESEVFVGGPVEQNTLHFIYFGSKLMEDSVRLADNLWWGGDFKELVRNLNTGIIQVKDVRFFIGYSGWASGQLADELEEMTWIVCDSIQASELFTDCPDDLWKNILKNMGGEYQILANYPRDPRLN